MWWGCECVCTVHVVGAHTDMVSISYTSVYHRQTDRQAGRQAGRQTKQTRDTQALVVIVLVGLLFVCVCVCVLFIAFCLCICISP